MEGGWQGRGRVMVGGTWWADCVTRARTCGREMGRVSSWSVMSHITIIAVMPITAGTAGSHHRHVHGGERMAVG